MSCALPRTVRFIRNQAIPDEKEIDIFSWMPKKKYDSLLLHFPLSRLEVPLLLSPPAQKKSGDVSLFEGSALDRSTLSYQRASRPFSIQKYLKLREGLILSDFAS